MTISKFHLVRILFVAILAISSEASAVKTADVIVNDEIVPLGDLGPLLKQKGYEVTLFRADSLDAATLLSRNADLLVILGGRQTVTRLHENPSFYDEIYLIRSRTAANLPVLGLCLGAQMIALAFGGEVVRGPVVEQGWIELQGTPLTETFPAVDELIKSNTKVYASHEDEIRVPPSAMLLAKSDLYDHVFVVGKNTVAVQFHPESTPEITHNWLKLFNGSEERRLKLHEENQRQYNENRRGIERFLLGVLDMMEANHE
jgi:GMP synthase (glutamine-hydrolysing)